MDEPCSRVHEDGYQMGEWDCSQGNPMNPDIARVDPSGSTLHLDYCAGYRSGYRFYQAEIRAERVRAWRNNRRALKGLKPIFTPVEYWRAECTRQDTSGDHKDLRHAQGMYQEALSRLLVVSTAGISGVPVLQRGRFHHAQ